MFKEKGIQTYDQTPWVDYIIINEKNGKRRLKWETPKEIKKMYKLHLKEQKMKKEKPIEK